MRVENVKGAVWTVDEIEFYKRRPQRCTSSSGSSGGQQLVGQQGSAQEGGQQQHPIGYVNRFSTRVEQENNFVFVVVSKKTFFTKIFPHSHRNFHMHFTSNFSFPFS